MKLEDVERLLKLIGQSDIAEFELESEGSSIKIIRSLKKGSKAGETKTIDFGSSLADHYGVLSAINTDTSQTIAVSEPQPTNNVKEATSGLHLVDCPIVGTFYSKPSPDAEPFVKLGDKIEKGATLCIVEAMKLMNEIPAPITGIIEKAHISDGAVVEYGEILFSIRPT